MLYNVKILVISVMLFLCSSLLILAGEFSSDSYVKDPSVDRGDLIPERKTECSLSESLGESALHYSGGGSLSAQEHKKLKSSVDDFLVNDDTTGGCGQNLPDIAKNTSGDCVVVWADGRTTTGDVYARRYDSSGVPIDSSFRVTEVPASASGAFWPAVAIDRYGGFVVVWSDEREHGILSADIYAQRYDSSGVPLGSNFRVNDGGESDCLRHPDVAIDSRGNFTITWNARSYKKEESGIYARRYDSAGTPLGSNFRVDDDTSNSYQDYPAVVADGPGNFVVTWIDSRGGDPDIYAQMFDSSGARLDSNFMVNSDTGATSEYYPDIAGKCDGSFVITWRDNREGNSDVYARRYDSDGNRLGLDFKVSDDTDSATQTSPAVSMDWLGGFVITWYDYRDDSNADVYAQRYDSSGIPAGVNFLVNDDADSARQLYPAVAMDSSGNFTIVWIDWRNIESDIYAQSYDPSATPMGPNYEVTDDDGTTSQRYPAIAADGAGNFVIVWEDGRRYNPDIYGQRYDISGSPLGANFRVNDDTGTADQSWPAVAMNASGDFVISWGDKREGSYYDIFAQRYDDSGAALGPNFMVSDSGSSSAGGSAIAMDEFGNFVVTWPDFRNGVLDVYAQRYDFSGTPVDTNFRVNDDTGSTLQWYPAIAMDAFCGFVIAWVDERNYAQYAQDVYAQRYDTEGNALGASFRVNDDSLLWTQDYPAVAMGNSGDFVITWRGYHPGVYVQRYDSSGSPVGGNFAVNDDSLRGFVTYTEVAMDDSGNFTVAWQDEWKDGQRTEDYDIYAQTFSPSGERISGNYFVPNPQYETYIQSYPGVAVYGSNIYFAWQDNRRAKGWDIYAKVIHRPSDEVQEDFTNAIPYSFDLSHNYPNPFNPSTTIEFSLKSSKSLLNRPLRTVLAIYNILGQKVRTLIDKERLPGNHKVTWDGKDNSGGKVASGVYFYRLQAGDFVQTRKMVLIR